MKNFEAPLNRAPLNLPLLFVQNRVDKNKEEALSLLQVFNVRVSSSRKQETS